ncbi:MAG TPA: cation diffusion facilitator family transporter [Solirubrobacteraceae bacterium]|nr:cation diffusion facilitator family transporter [Solirubrobacteraceae bacterium]
MHDHSHGHDHIHASRDADRRSLAVALALILAFMAVEIVAGILASSLALLSDAGHMLTDAAALAISLAAARLATRPAYGAMTYGLGRAEILSAAANGLTLLVLAGLIVYGAIVHLASPPAVRGGVVLGVALAGIVVNLVAARVLAGGHGDGHGHGHGHARSLNVEGSYRHILTDLYGFIATAIAGGVILATGFDRADAIASLLIAALMLQAAYHLLMASGRVFMEAAPAGLDPDQVGHELAAHPGVVEVHDLHVWEVTSGFAALSAHVVVRADDDCHELRRSLERLLEERFDIHHTTLQVDHEAAPLQIEVAPRSGAE